MRNKMKNETVTHLENDDLIKKRKCSPHEKFEISESGVQDTLPGTSSSSQFAVSAKSDAAVQIKRTRMGRSTENVDLAITDEISHMSTPTRIEPSPQVDADRALNSASQSSSELTGIPAIKKGNENSPQNEPDAAQTNKSDHELREQSDKLPEKTDQAADEDAVLQAMTLHQDNPAELVNFLPQQVPPKRKKLLVLDINGLLADIVSPIPKDYKSDTNIARRAIFKRPFCTDFLKFCFETFEVGIWSSRTQKNVERVTDFLLGDLKDQLLFCWDVTQCTATGFRSLENRHKTLMFKEIRKLWEPEDHDLPWKNGHFNKSNTLLVDDSPYKALLNPPHTAIFPPSYSYQDSRDTYLGLGGDILAYLEGLAAADHVQQYVEQHPFGQGAISQANPSWDFYYKAVISLFTLQSPTT